MGRPARDPDVISDCRQARGADQGPHRRGVHRPHAAPHGTRLINTGVPQHVVQKLLGHASPEMTAHSARAHP
ncbi:MAG: tyrosine-type recombinase/integrase [Streptosporangiaceae bacterium]